ncbi:MAG: hypothetical protein IPH96_13135 [Saprospiraceae bacterium]|nr:hypothetical protein [Saprospiraceae bacterium]
MQDPTESGINGITVVLKDAPERQSHTHTTPQASGTTIV